MKKKKQNLDIYSREAVKKLLHVSAHQLRGPITTIQTQLETILGGYAGEVPGKIKRMLDSAHQKSEDMLTLLGDLLDLARIEDKNIKEQFKAVNLEQLFSHVVEQLRSRAELKGIEFEIVKEEELPVVWGYRKGLEAVFHNLIENAIKYTPQNGRVQVYIKYYEKKNILSGKVIDTGIGIDDEAAKHIFTEFYRAPNATSEESVGTGLGLAIVEKAARIHGGEVMLEKMKEKGTCFRFLLPLVKIADGAGEGKKDQSERQRSRIVVIGGRTAGPKTAAKARRMDEDVSITIIEKDELLSYAGCGLPYYISGMVNDRQVLMTTNDGDIRDPEFFRKIKDINVLNRTVARSIDRERKVVVVQEYKARTATEISYDKLVLATGSRAIIPKIKGIDKDKIFTLQKVSDAEGLRKELRIEAARDIVIIGGGLIGIESAEALALKGARVTIIESTGQVLSFLDPEFADLVKKYFESRGIRVLLNHKVTEITGETAVTGVIANDRTIPADLVILSVGVVPEATLARDAGLEIGKTGGIRINELLQTSDPDIFAVGDCVENTSLITGEPLYTPLGSIANRQGRTAGMNVTGADERFTGVLRNVILKVFNYNIAAVGVNERQARQAGLDPVSVIVPAPDREHYFPGAELIFLKIIVAGESKRIIGAQAIGRGDVSKRIDVIAMAITGKMTMWDLSKLDLAYAPPFSSPMDIVITAANVLKNKCYGSYKGISVLDLKERLREKHDILLVDVRSPKEYDEHSIPGAISIPLNSLRGRMGSLPKEREIVIYCRSGVNSYEAYRLLQSNGFENIKILEGGILTFFGENILFY